jgi:hypothetical protein
MVALPAFLVAFILSLVTGASTFLLAGGFVVCAAAVAWFLDLKSRFKFITHYPDPFWRRWHIAGWKLGFYDKFLDPRVRFARHALAIDETRAAFARVPWGVRGQSGPLVPGEPDRLIQWWFAGDHSDIGGSYAEEESRLSDVALEWMIEEATRIPCPINIDRSRLRTYPSAAGMQHSEVTSLLDRYPNWVRGWLPGWTVKPRTEARGAPWHPSVLQRFQLESVQQSALRAPYRPESLRLDERVADLYR